MSEEPDLSTSEVKPGKIGGSQVHMVPTGHMKPIPTVTKTVHGNVERLTNPASSLKITSGLGTQVQNNGNELVLATQTMPLDVWQSVPEIPEPDQSDPIGRFDDPLILSNDYAAVASDQWHLWTTSAGNKTEDKLGVSIRLYDRTLIFDSVGNLVKIKPKFSEEADGRLLHPWQCYITESAPDNCKLKINPNSSLMQTYDYRSTWSSATWKDQWTHPNIGSFTDEFICTDNDQMVWMEVVFSGGDIDTVDIVKGIPGIAGWNTDLRFVSSSNSYSAGGSFTWYQLLAYFKLSASGDGGDEVDAVFGGTNYKLMCPTTTHLMQAAITASVGAASNQHYHAIVPWYGMLFPDS